MTIGKRFWKTLELEAEVTRKYLALVPFDKANFKPSEQSENMGRLAVHLAEIIAWWTSCVRDDNMDFEHFEPKEVNNTAELLAYFDHLLEEAKQALLEVKDEEFDKKWTMTCGEELYFELEKRQVAERFCMHHFVHHRAQLGVYLRILGIALPATYGPSAEDFEVVLTRNIFA